MDSGPSVDIPECEECGQPWTTDMEQHRRSVWRGLRVFICDGCLDAQLLEKTGGAGVVLEP